MVYSTFEKSIEAFSSFLFNVKEVLFEFTLDPCLCQEPNAFPGPRGFVAPLSDTAVV